MAHKVAFCSDYGGFGLSRAAHRRLRQLGVYAGDWHIPRHHPLLIQVIEELGDEAASEYCTLGIAELDGNRYIIRECEGVESVIEPHEIDWITIW